MKKQKIYDHLFELYISTVKQLHPKTAKVLIDLGYVEEVCREERCGFGIFKCIFHKVSSIGEHYLLEHLREIGKEFKE